jgi:hypothetical protein
MCVVYWSEIHQPKYQRVFIFNGFRLIYEQRERVFHRERLFHKDIQTQENNVWKHKRVARVFSYIVFSCLDILVRHELELFIWLLKLMFSFADLNRILNQA